MPVEPVVIQANKPEPPEPRRVAAGLEPNTDPLTEQQAYHLLRRTQYGAVPAVVQALVGRPADEVVDELIATAMTVPNPPDPAWIDDAPGPGEDDYFERSVEWFYLTSASIFKHILQNGFGEKMTLFWHNHFVTAFFDSHEISPITYRYLKLLRKHAFGNFETFVREIGLDMSMLIYLDGQLNEVGAPNENYARELLELFTMGILGPSGAPNYTEADIAEVARALTGYRVDEETLSVHFDQALHDDGVKTFFGSTGNWGYDDVVDIIFQARSNEIAHFISSKFYKEFVFEAPQADIVDGLAQEFVRTGFDIASTVAMLLKSRHFFEEEFMGAHIKSPTELYAGLMQDLGIVRDNERFHIEMVFASEDSGQQLLHPPNVAGWPGYRTWLTTASIPIRWAASQFLTGEEEFYRNTDLQRFVRDVHNWNDPLAVFRLPVALVRHLIALPITALSIEPISAPWAGGQPIPSEIEQEPAYVHDLTKRMLGGIPWYEWDLGTDEARYAIRDFLVYIFELPEFQLS